MMRVVFLCALAYVCMGVADEPKGLSPQVEQKIQNALDAEKKIHTPPELPEDNSLPPLTPESYLPQNQLPDQTPDACSALSEEEIKFANSLDPIRKEVFCKTFSLDMRKMAMNMVGRRTAAGDFLTPVAAFDLVAKENDILIPDLPGAPPS